MPVEAPSTHVTATDAEAVRENIPQYREMPPHAVHQYREMPHMLHTSTMLPEGEGQGRVVTHSTDCSRHRHSPT